MQANCTIEINIAPDGKVCRIIHENGRIIAEFIVHGPLDRVIQNCNEMAPILNGRPNVFRGELYGLAGYEYLNVEEGRVEER